MTKHDRDFLRDLLREVPEASSEEKDVEALERAVSALDEAAERDRRALLESVEEQDQGPAFERAEEALLQAMERDEVALPGIRSFAWMPLTAAALFLIALGVHFFRGETQTPARTSGIFLGGDFELHEPTGTDASFSSFRWESHAPEGGYYEVRVRPSDGANAVFESGKLDQAQWTLTKEQAAELPDEILWEVRAYDPFGQQQGIASARARR